MRKAERELRDSIPEIPENGNYVVTGQNLWSHAESLSKALDVWTGAGGEVSAGNHHGPDPLLDLAIVDVSNDFRISHMDGGVRARNLTVVHVQNCDWLDDA